ncbi:MAG: hypothetical protein U1A72_16870 [Sulfuritalea sp.]|nr:hypothetical protein [Sulfuritalea sp.]
MNARILAALALLAGCATPDATGEPPKPAPPVAPLTCNAKDTVAATLKDRYGEKPMDYGLTEGGALMQIFVSPKGTWSAVVTHANGVSCLIAAGNYWTGAATDRGI